MIIQVCHLEARNLVEMLTIAVNNGGLSRKHLIEGTNAALKRLQLDYGEVD